MKLLHKTVLQHCSDMLAKRLNAPTGLRDEKLLDAAFGRVDNYLHFHSTADVFDLGAQYAQGIIQNHPFIDSNKRIAYIACMLFLRLNGWRVAALKQEKLKAFNDFSTFKTSASDFAAWMRQYARRI